MTIREAYAPAMEITDQAEADRYFQKLVERCMGFGNTREQAMEIERHNLGYYAGYYGPHVRERVEHLFNCAHPFFGPIATKGEPTPAEAFELGRKWASDLKRKEGV